MPSVTTMPASSISGSGWSPTTARSARSIPADVAGDPTIDEHRDHLGIGHHADAVLDPDRTEVLDGEAHFGRAACSAHGETPGSP